MDVASSESLVDNTAILFIYFVGVSFRKMKLFVFFFMMFICAAFLDMEIYGFNLGKLTSFKIAYIWKALVIFAMIMERRKLNFKTKNLVMEFSGEKIDVNILL